MSTGCVNECCMGMFSLFFPLSISLLDTNTLLQRISLTILLGMSHHVAPLAYVATGLQSTCSCRAPHSFHSLQVSLVVNVASECGFTEEHYKDLQQIQRDYGPYHFNVLAFPCNQFGQQEPGSDKDIDSFVRRVYGVSFPLFSKIAVVGTGANNVYKYLVESSEMEPDWNFWKYLIDVDGKVVDAWGPKVSVREIRPKIAEMVRQIILKKKEEL
ncbi:glutathione peroxidase 7 isoform X1 [Trematomus bernacchii]|uniref:glutathione peroxidase 7 isoform X1 n=1 Tax=Trematomus bernacchii TaxID=40690 RepID=UPI00146F2513|nr:glutathione peroxidase 7 isoform X1 [Trematomus bernacchii]